MSVSLFYHDYDDLRTNDLAPGGTLPIRVLNTMRGQTYGAEVAATGRVTRAWTVFAGYTFLDSKILKSNNGVAPTPIPTLPDEGKRLQNTPKHSANFWTTYDLSSRVTVGGAYRFVDSRYGNNANTRRVDAYWTVDLMASYRLSERVDVRFNVFNLNDAYYFDRLGGGHLIPGPARSANVSLGFKF